MFAESKPQNEQESIVSSSSDDDLDHSEQRHAVYMLPVQLVRHMQNLQQNIDADTWQMVWSLYASEDVLPGELHI